MNGIRESESERDLSIWIWAMCKEIMTNKSVWYMKETFKVRKTYVRLAPGGKRSKTQRWRVNAKCDIDQSIFIGNLLFTEWCIGNEHEDERKRDIRLILKGVVKQCDICRAQETSREEEEEEGTRRQRERERRMYNEMSIYLHTRGGWI